MDALSTLLSNRLDYPVTHDGPDLQRFNSYRLHQKRLQVLAESENFVLLPIIVSVRRFFRVILLGLGLAMCRLLLQWHICLREALRGFCLLLTA